MSEFTNTPEESFDSQPRTGLEAFTDASAHFDQAALNDGFARAEKYPHAADPRTGSIMTFVSNVVSLESGNGKLSDDQVTGIFLNVITRRLQSRTEGDTR